MQTRWSERDLIDLLVEKVSVDSNVLGHNEDAIAVSMGDQYLVLNIDGWVQSTDRPPGVTLSQAACRAVANSLSDIYAKGTLPTGFSISYTIPREMHLYPQKTGGEQYTEAVQDIITGVNQAVEKYKVPYLGGDINEGKDLVIDVVSWGFTDRPVARSGADVGELVYWIGPPLGSTAAALGILTKGWAGRKERAVEIMGEPELYPEILRVDASAAVDCSDGLARTLHLLAQASGVGIDLDGSVRIDPWVNMVAQANDIPLTDLMFYGGEELGIVFTCAEGTELPDSAIKLGKVMENQEIVLGDDRIPDRGWEHFS